MDHHNIIRSLNAECYLLFSSSPTELFPTLSPSPGPAPVLALRSWWPTSPDLLLTLCSSLIPAFLKNKTQNNKNNKKTSPIYPDIYWAPYKYVSNICLNFLYISKNFEMVPEMLRIKQSQFFLKDTTKKPQEFNRMSVYMQEEEKGKER